MKKVAPASESRRVDGWMGHGEGILAGLYDEGDISARKNEPQKNQRSPSTITEIPDRLQISKTTVSAPIVPLLLHRRHPLFIANTFCRV